MKIINGLNNSYKELEGCVVTIGNFDGFHIGHRQLVERTTREARLLKVPSVVLTFSPHPVQVLKPNAPFMRLFDENDQKEVLESMGVDVLVILEFTKEFSQKTPEEFFEAIIYQKLKPQLLVLGFDFHFGNQRTGDLHFLENECQKYQIGLVIIPPFLVNQEKASSTRVRDALSTGDMELVQKILLRPYYLQGSVVRGHQRGQKDLVRTLNLKPETSVPLRQGVYVTLVKWNEKIMQSVTNVGLNPTFEDFDKKLKIETHLLNEDVDLYDETIRVEFLKFIRDEKKMSSVKELKEQIERDIAFSRSYLSH